MIEACHKKLEAAPSNLTAKARAASRSLTGSRMPGTVTRDAQDDEGGDDVEADVRRAMRLVRAG